MCCVFVFPKLKFGISIVSVWEICGQGYVLLGVLVGKIMDLGFVFDQRNDWSDTLTL